MTPKKHTRIKARDIARAQRDSLREDDEPADEYRSDQEEGEPVRQATHDPTLPYDVYKVSFAAQVGGKMLCNAHYNLLCILGTPCKS